MTLHKNGMSATLTLRSEAEDNLHDAISRLPDHHRVVVEMMLAGCSQIEIADELGLIQQAISARYRGSLGKLRLALGVQ